MTQDEMTEGVGRLCRADVTRTARPLSPDDLPWGTARSRAWPQNGPHISVIIDDELSYLRNARCADLYTRSSVCRARGCRILLDIITTKCSPIRLLGRAYHRPVTACPNREAACFHAIFAASPGPAYQIEGHSFGGAGPIGTRFPPRPAMVRRNGAIACDHTAMVADLDLMNITWTLPLSPPARVMPQGMTRPQISMTGWSTACWNAA